ncbi:unnamed protein product [Brassica napus]|uniref:(rape) hypothetical protein n=1 Tax=Brassica napus TaxID=3708 RepID=A0A816MIY9_BRANA|nr:unnamed protein product [Brassica napus]
MLETRRITYELNTFLSLPPGYRVTPRKAVGLQVYKEVELLKERMAKLLLGEDMSGSGEGVCPAISNAITNLYRDKWWLPLPCVPSDGFSEQSKKQLDCTYDFTNQILKACKSVNNIALAEMEVPKAYIEARPKNGRPCLGDFLYRNITSDNFSADPLVQDPLGEGGDSEKDDESSGNTFDWSEKGSGSQLKRAQERERESIIPKR